jgi:glycerophosphoryl diester phosphodiesterase
VNPHFTSVDDAVMARAHELQLLVNVWTVNTRADLERMTALGVASIITDDPELALEVVTGELPTSAGR